MRAIVCDKCGRVVLCETEWGSLPDGICRLSDGRVNGVCLDLCTECTAHLIDAVREQADDE